MRDFNHTVNVLVNAFFNGTLAHGTCFACAVGNIVAESIGSVVIKRKSHVGEFSWHDVSADFYPAYNKKGDAQGLGAVFYTSCPSNKQMVSIREYSGNAKFQIDSAGYSVEELAKIEFAFETADHGGDNEEWMFNGLMAVVDVLAEIHKVDLSVRESAKSLFTKA